MVLTVRAFAKVNLTLEVLGPRPDGYHEITSVLQTVSLCDEISFEPQSHLSVLTYGAPIPGAENLVTRAALLLQQSVGVDNGARIRIQKRIPIGAGLGGGSSDAAATLWALDRLWDLHLPLDRLCAIATHIGSDVPFFLTGGTALATGRGELVRPLPPAAERWFLIAYPHLAVPDKTATMYSHVSPQHWTAGRVTYELTKTLKTTGRIREACLFSAFDAVAFEVLPELHELRRRLLEVAASRPHVAGAGPSLFIPLDGEDHGRRVVAALHVQHDGPEDADYFVVRTVPAARDIIEDG